MTDDDKEQGPDLTAGIDAGRLADGEPLEGRVGEHAVILVRDGDDIHALGAHCPHRGAALADGLVVGGTIRCPWHHASFALADGAARAPSLDPLPCWRVERDGDTVRVRERLERDAVPAVGRERTGGATPDSVVIVGAGAAGEAAAETLRAHGYEGPVTLLSADEAAPLDRTNLSKGYLAGEMEETKLALRDASFYRERDLELRLGSRVVAIDPKAHEVRLEGGETLAYGKLLLATGASPRALDVDGADDPHVHYLRDLDDARGIVAAADGARRAVVVGASFIGLEAAAALVGRGLETTVVAPDEVPLGSIMGEELGRFVQGLHEDHGVRFRLGRSVEGIETGAAAGGAADGGDERDGGGGSGGEASGGDGARDGARDGVRVRLDDGETLSADLVVVGIGVRPDTALAEAAGLETDDGIVVDERLGTSDPDIFAAGDVASWPDPRGRRLRIEHWQLAQRHGQCAARNILGAAERFADVPFFWSKHYDTNIRYAGHAEKIARIETDGRLEDGDFEARVEAEDGTPLAMASVGRDRANLAFAARLEAARAPKD